MSLLIFLVIFAVCVNCEEETTTVPSTTVVYFSEMPENMQINYIDPMTFIRYENRGEVIMGLPDVNCDNARVNISDKSSKRSIQMIPRYS